MAVHNGLCDNWPDVLVVVAGEEDVVAAVRLVGQHGLQLSVRSGGHSYACQSSRRGGLQLDMRRMAGVSLVRGEYTHLVILFFHTQLYKLFSKHF